MARTTIGFLALAASLIAPGAPSQTSIVLPPSHGTVEGTGATNLPFGRSTPARVQAAYDGSMFAVPVSVQGIAWRIDGGQAAAAKRVDVEIRLSTMTGSITGLQSAFAANTGTDEVVVVDRRILDLPAQSAGSGPQPFSVRIPFDRSFAYDPARGALLVDVVVHGQPPAPYTIDTTFTCTSDQRSFGPVGCGAAGRILRADSATTQVQWGKPLALRVYDAPPDAPTSLFLGSIESGVWNGLTIPFDLGVIGASGCSLATDVLATLGVLADGNGVAVYPFAVPNLPRLRGEWIRFQGVALDPSANPLGVVTSQGHKVQICGWEPVARLYATGTGATVGFAEIGVAPVVELTVQ